MFGEEGWGYEHKCFLFLLSGGESEQARGNDCSLVRVMFDVFIRHGDT